MARNALQFISQPRIIKGGQVRDGQGSKLDLLVHLIIKQESLCWKRWQGPPIVLIKRDIVLFAKWAVCLGPNPSETSENDVEDEIPEIPSFIYLEAISGVGATKLVEPQIER